MSPGYLQIPNPNIKERKAADPATFKLLTAGPNVTWQCGVRCLANAVLAKKVKRARPPLRTRLELL
jgi:hypothetical protein